MKIGGGLTANFGICSNDIEIAKRSSHYGHISMSTSPDSRNYDLRLRTILWVNHQDAEGVQLRICDFCYKPQGTNFLNYTPMTSDGRVRFA